MKSSWYNAVKPQFENIFPILASKESLLVGKFGLLKECIELVLPAYAGTVKFQPSKYLHFFLPMKSHPTSLLSSDYLPK